MPVWLFIKGLSRFIPAKAAMWGAITTAAGIAVLWLRRDAVKDDRQKQENADLKGKIKANELEEQAENEAENKSDADLIAGNSRGMRDKPKG